MKPLFLLGSNASSVALKSIKVKMQLCTINSLRTWFKSDYALFKGPNVLCRK